VQRGSPQPVKCKGIAVHVRTLLEVDVPSQRLDVHDVGVGGLVEVQDDERADRSGVCTCTVGDDLNGGLAPLGRLDQVAELPSQPPAPRDLGEDGLPDPNEESGRGLFLVAALSTRWDWYLTQEPAGKVVWCEVDAELPEPSAVAQSAPQALLPWRTAAPPR
jgi:hypothetical protein